MAWKSHLGLVLVLAVFGAAPGCGAGGMADMGATPGGSQDTGLARDIIEQGGVPLPEDVTVEGMLNEHDLPLEAPACERDLCIRAAYGIAPTLDGGPASVFVQMGFASGIDPATFHRAPLNLAVVVDRSGSMSGEKIESVRQALGKLIDQLGPEDRLAIVLFDDQVDVLVESTPVTDRAALKSRLWQISARGTTDMASGLRAGYGQVEAHLGAAGVADRVMVFTDAQTNTGDTNTSTFIELASAGAARGIGLTVFGVGIDLNQELVLAVSKLRGGNYFYLEDGERIATVFDEDFDYLVTPLAYDLHLHLEAAPGMRVSAVYGYPSWSPSAGAVDIFVTTVFLSRNHGALVARLERDGEWPSCGAPVAELALSYRTPDGEPVSEAVTSTYDGDAELADDSVFYSQRAVRKTVALVNAGLALREACRLYWDGDVYAAEELLDRARDLLRSESATLEDGELAAEAELIEQLLLNMGAGAYYPEGGCYDSYDGGCGTQTVCATVAGRGRTSAAGVLAVLGLAAALGARRRRAAWR